MLLLGVLLVIIIHVTTSCNLPRKEDCPFFVAWNAETKKCKTKYGIDVNPEKYGILENKIEGSQGWWMGEKIDIIYRPGLWPEIKDDGTVLYGGVPQAGDIEAHLAQVVKDVDKYVPDPNFNGYGILDCEEWRPIFDTNWGKLTRNKYYSRQLVKERHPDWSAKQVDVQARIEFEQAARIYLTETINLAKRLRPKAVWGYYIFPDCYHNKTSGTCKETSFAWNERIHWLAEASTALYPSTYYFLPTDLTQTRQMTYGNMDASKRWREYIGEPKLPIIMYSKWALIPPEPFYTLGQLDDSIGLSADLGADGVILWSNHYSEKTRESCEHTQSYLETTLGPYVQHVLAFYRQCSATVCNNHGRCTLKDPRSGITQKSMRPLQDYMCSCYPGYKGSNCLVI